MAEAISFLRRTGAWFSRLGRSQAEPEIAQAALAELCQTYWAPLYSFVRSRGYAMEDAQDLTQSFFAYLIEHKIYARVDRRKVNSDPFCWPP